MRRDPGVGERHGGASILAILAGTSHRDAPIDGETSKALLTVGMRTSLAHVLRAADETKVFREVYVVGRAELDHAIVAAGMATPVRLIAQGQTLVENMGRAFGVAAVGPRERLFFTAADIPLVKPGELVRFVELVGASRADACVALAHAERSDATKPLLDHYRRSMIIARGGPFLMGNLFALRSRVLRFAEVMTQARRVRRQSSAANIARACVQLGLLGKKAAPALVTFLRLVVARALWLNRGHWEWTPTIAPSTESIRRSISVLTSASITVEFFDVGLDGACYDIDTVDQHEALRHLL